MTMLENIFIGAAIFIMILAFASLYRAMVGPTAADRVVAINMISTKVSVIIILVALVLEQKNYVDVALIYAMVGFITTVSVAKYLEKGKLF
jgi:multicomponent Na+:H+ antiporter subunit F